MKYNPEIHHRASIRLQGYDYSSVGAYFVTICTFQRECLFGEIIDGRMMLNEYGKIVNNEWIKSSDIRQEIELDELIVMPNHFHAIIFITTLKTLETSNSSSFHNPNQETTLSMKPKSLSSLIAGFKSATTTRINTKRDTAGTPVWQRNYYDNIIRNELALEKIRQYIHNNPISWEIDQLHPNIPSKW
jgi:putative transposase